MREVLGESLRARRVAQGRTLRDVSHGARISLGYLSEIERGQKEASSELLAAIAGALELPLSRLLADVVERLAVQDQASDWAVLSQVAA
jgi:transcriptional regulator with XRE-family HTH domain